MNRSDIPLCAFRPQLKDVQLAFGLLTRLPFPYGRFDPDNARPLAHAAWAYPVVGVAIALLSGLGGWVALSVGLPAAVAALFVLAIGQMSTGALHEDGLADCADGFWGGWTSERRLEIMKDSQIGTYGVLALLVVTGLRWMALSALIATDSFLIVLVCVAVSSRAGMVLVMRLLPNARRSGLSAQTGRPPTGAVWIAGTMGALALFALPGVFLAASGVTIVTLLAIYALAKTKIGGQTGDVLGATQQLMDCALLLTCLAALH